MSKILLLEPDRLLGRIYTKTLTDAGYAVQCAVSAEQAVQLADAEKPDAAIVSMELARHNGVEFLYEFRSYSEWQDIPALVLTDLPSTELLGNTMLREQLAVHAVLVRSQTSTQDLVRALRRAMKPARTV